MKEKDSEVWLNFFEGRMRAFMRTVTWIGGCGRVRASRKEVSKEGRVVSHYILIRFSKLTTRAPKCMFGGPPGPWAPSTFSTSTAHAYPVSPLTLSSGNNADVRSCLLWNPGPAPCLGETHRCTWKLRGGPPEALGTAPCPAPHRHWGNDNGIDMLPEVGSSKAYSVSLRLISDLVKPR